MNIEFTGDGKIKELIGVLPKTFSSDQFQAFLAAINAFLEANRDTMQFKLAYDYSYDGLDLNYYLFVLREAREKDYYTPEAQKRKQYRQEKLERLEKLESLEKKYEQLIEALQKQLQAFDT